MHKTSMQQKYVYVCTYMFAIVDSISVILLCKFIILFVNSIMYSLSFARKSKRWWTVIILQWQSERREKGLLETEIKFQLILEVYVRSQSELAKTRYHWHRIFLSGVYEMYKEIFLSYLKIIILIVR